MTLITGIFNPNVSGQGNGAPGQLSTEDINGFDAFRDGTKRGGQAKFDNIVEVVDGVVVDGADAGKSAIVVTTMTVEQPGGHVKTETAVAAVFDVRGNKTVSENTAKTELLAPKKYDNGSLVAKTTWQTTTYEYAAADLAAAQSDFNSGTFNNAINSKTVTEIRNSKTNVDISYGSGVTAVVEASTGEQFLIQSDGTAVGRTQRGTNFPEGTTFRLKSVTVPPVSGYEGDFSDYKIKVGGVFANGINTVPQTTIDASDGPGTYEVDIPFGIAQNESLDGNSANILSVNVVGREINEDGFLATGVSFQPTPGGVQAKETSTVLTTELDAATAVVTQEELRTIISQIDTSISVSVTNSEPDPSFPDGNLTGSSSGRSISIGNKPPYHIHQDDDFLTAWQNIATAMTELATISTTLKGYTESIKNDISVFKSLGTNSNQGISTKEVFVNTACRGGGLQPAIVIEALQDAGIWEDVLKELGDPLHMPSGERQSQKDAKNA